MTPDPSSNQSAQHWRPEASRAAVREDLARRGAIVPIGGGEARVPDNAVLDSFVDLAGKNAARIMVLTTASPDERVVEKYVKALSRIGAAVEVAHVTTREQANDPELAGRMAEMTGLLFTGVTQWQLSSLVAGTPLAEAIRTANAHGLVVAGTGAGSSILGGQMLPEAGPYMASPFKGMIDSTPGLGLLNGSIIDHHARIRDRIGYLLTIFALHPGLMAIGVDDNTALIITPDGTANVVGQNGAIVVDGRHVRSDHSERLDDEILTVTGGAFHLLGPGRIFDLERCRVLDPQREQSGLPAG